MLLSQRACKRIMCVIFSSWLLMWMFSLFCWKRQKQKWEDFWVVPHDCICAGLGMQPPESSGAEVLSSLCKSSNDRLRRLHLFPRKCWDEQVNCMPEELVFLQWLEELSQWGWVSWELDHRRHFCLATGIWEVSHTCGHTCRDMWELPDCLYA